MKVLHTSDWHLGARLGRHDRQADHQVALSGLLKVAEEEQPDLILHTGDLFDASRPPYAALGLGITALQRLASVAPTVVLCGNHDSPALFGVLDRLVGEVEPRRLWFLIEPKVLEFSNLIEVPVALASVPFIPPSAIANFAADDVDKLAGNYADGVGKINECLLNDAKVKVGTRGIVLYAAHLHVQGAKPSKSEKLITVGEDYATHVRGLEDASYCAFGHIHDPQLLPGTTNGRYAGSLIPLDFGESCQTKQAVVVDIGNDVRVEKRDLPSGRPLIPFQGTVAELERRAAGGALNGCILKARVESDDPVLNVADRLADSPDCAVFEIVNIVANTKVRAVAEPTSEAEEEPSEGALFEEWLANAAPASAKTAPAEKVVGLFAEALAAVPDECDPNLGVNQLQVDAEKALAMLTPKNSGT